MAEGGGVCVFVEEEGGGGEGRGGGGKTENRSLLSPFPLPNPSSPSPLSSTSMFVILCFNPTSTDTFKHFGDTSTNSTNGADSKGGANTMITSYVDTRRLIQVGDEYDDSG